MNWEIWRKSMVESTAICTADSKSARSVSGQIQNLLDVSPCHKSNKQPICHRAVCENDWCMYLYIGDGLRMGVSANITL